MMEPIAFVSETKLTSDFSNLNIQLKDLYHETLSMYNKCQAKKSTDLKETYKTLLKKYKDLHSLKQTLSLKYKIYKPPSSTKSSNSSRTSRSSLNSFSPRRDSFAKMLTSTK